MIRAARTHRRNEEFIQNFWVENRKRRHHLEDIGVGSSVVIKINVKETGVNRIHLVQDRNHWRALVIMVMNLRIP
jgi:hypothetical protein